MQVAFLISDLAHLMAKVPWYVGDYHRILYSDGMVIVK